VSCPGTLNPTLFPSPGNSIISVNVANYATISLKVVQNNQVLAEISPQVQGSPSVTRVQLDRNQNTFILDHHQNWILVCNVGGGTLQDGWIVRNNVKWGNPCNVSQ